MTSAVVADGTKDAEVPNIDQGWGCVDLAETLFSSNCAVKIIDCIPFAAKRDCTWVVTTTNDAPTDVQLAEGGAVLYGNGGSAADALNTFESVRLAASGEGRNADFVTVSCKDVVNDHEDGGAAALYLRGAFDPDEVHEYATVRIGTREFVTLDLALAAARELAPLQTDPVLVEILAPTVLMEAQTIDFGCTIVATNLDPSASAVTRREGAALNVAANGFLSLENVVFVGSSETAVDVASNGVVAVGGLVDFGVPYTAAAVRTAATNGFSVTSALVRGFTLDCMTADGEDQAFGFGQALAGPAFDGITNTVDLIADFHDPLGEMRGYVVGDPNDYVLVWRQRQVPFEESVGYFVDADGKTNTAARIDRLVEGYRQARDEGRLGDVRRIVLRREGTLSQPLTVGEDLELVGETGIVVALEGSAGFTLTAGTLSVTGITFSNYVGNALFLVNGESAALKLGAGVVMTDIRGTNWWSGAVTVLKGSAAVSDGVRFTRCLAKGYDRVHRAIDSYGGAVYLAAGGTLSLADCTIENGHASSHGGAVYAEAGSSVMLSGELQVAGNTEGSSKSFEDDLYLKGNARLVLSGLVVGSVGIYRSNDDKRFADAASAQIAEASASAFFSNEDPDVVAEADPPAGLRWTVKPVEPQPWMGDPAKASARVTYPGQSPVYYLLVSEALEALTGDATVEIVGQDAVGRVLTSDVEIRHEVTLVAADASLALERWGDCSIKIVKGGMLKLKDVTVYGCRMNGSAPWDAGSTSSVPVFDVCGGKLILGTPSAGRKTEITHVYGDLKRNAGAVSVWQRGTFRIESGASIHDCTNLYRDDGSGAGRGGAVLVDNGFAELFGGTITDCRANHGGVFIGNDAQVEVKGDLVIDGNFRLDGETPSNLYVYDRGQMVLTGKLTGHVGYTEGVFADTNVFGRIDGSSVAAADRQASAHNFTHDTNGDIGLAVGDGGENFLLVWGSSLAADGTYTDADGKTYWLLDGPLVKLDLPSAYEGLVYDGTPQVGVDGLDFFFENNVAVNAGFYVARVTPRPGFSWQDGSTGAKAVDWQIARATHDISGVSFTDATYIYDGTNHSIAVSGEIPAGVEVVYSGDPTNRTEVGTNVVTASFNVLDRVNYEEITTTMTARLIIKDDSPVPPPPGPVVTNWPTAIAFESITRIADTGWALVVTNRVQWCRYRLICTPDLAQGFTTTGNWEQATADGPWTTNVIFSAEEAEPAYFWRAEGTWGIVPEE